ncbi:phospholipase D2 isoform X1 [Anopheles aquasalis]|uniref:phospholipase D2 isoform X1 n=2 Tax=Anopheles aquasalis TaxID=42839 RepID=UPI00215B5281|nr:phospholipase D2 isoform X1 [Anopheles aquasalis]
MDANYKRKTVHRSISLLLRDIDQISMSDMGTSNPALSCDDATTTSPATGQAEPVTPGGGMFDTSLACYSLRSEAEEFDENLDAPDSVTYLSIGGPNPVLVIREGDADSGSTVSEIPYNYVYNPPVKFDSMRRHIFIPGLEINVEIIDNERNLTSHVLNPNLYTVKLTHGQFTWTIQKRYNHFRNLHQQLTTYRTSLHIPFPTKSHRERRDSFRNMHTVHQTTASPAMQQKLGKPLKKIKKSALPRFPLKPDSLVSFDAVPQRMKQLEEYLYNLLNISLYRNFHGTVNFLEVSHLSFIAALGDKGKEGLIKKRTGSTRAGQSGCNFCGCLTGGCCVRCSYFCSDVVWSKWRNRWFFVKETCFGYYRPKDGVLRCVVLFDQGFDISSGMYSTGMRNGLQIATNSRYLVIKHPTRRMAKDWMRYMKGVANESARDFTLPNPHQSFAPSRPGVQAGWFVDGAGYMSAVADALEGATEEIFITDWMLSPEIYMKRPAIDGDYWRLDKILKRKAEQGIKIFVLLFKELDFALGINSYYSKQKLVEQHENIKVLRHPDHAKAGILFWAHHEKLVIVDQTYAFVGGIDLCYGRWDDYKHRLTDLGSISSSTTSSANNTTTRKPSTVVELDENGSVANLLKSSKNIAIATAVDRQEAETAAAARAIQAAQGGGEAPGASITPAESKSEKQKKFVQTQPDVVKEATGGGGDESSSHKLLVAAAQALSMVNSERQQVTEERETSMPENIKQNTPEMGRRNMMDKLKDMGRDWKNRMTLTDQQGEEVDGNTKSTLSSPGYLSEEERRKRQLYAGGAGGDGASSVLSPQPFKSKFTFELDGQAKLWIGKDYINFIVKDFTNLDSPYVDLVDRSTTVRMPWHDVATVVLGPAARDVARHFIERWNAVKLEKCRENTSYPYLLPKSYNDIRIDSKFLNVPLHHVTCQVLRSASSWNCGFIEPDCVEQSIHEAYVQTISKAQHYIYIENQFFISLEMGNGVVKNQIADYLFKRIVRAHRDKKVFRVYVVMPLLPGFEGDVGGSTGISLRAITHWNYASISRGKSSLLTRLRAAGIEKPFDYISFHSLRTNSTLNGMPVTELIYVHSKLLIADDKVVICGSANINDRSLIGKRDSEVCVMITDESFEEGRMNGESYPCGIFAGKLRKFLFREHLGLLEPEPNRAPVDVTDPVIDSFWTDVWRKTSYCNTHIYDEVFRCIPSDAVQSFVMMKRFLEDKSLLQSNPDAIQKAVSRIVGNLVDLPLKFLCKEVLTPPGASKEGMMPTYMWT